MATRAAIIYLDPENYQAISTYNHYDGYPENLGEALENHYNDDMYAKKIASEGYISYLDPETGDVEVSNPRDKDVDPIRIELSDDEGRSAYAISNDIQSKGADWAYIWSPALDKWTTIKNDGRKTTLDRLEQMMPELFGMGNMEDDMMEGKNFMTEWQSFLNESNDIDKVLSQAMFKLQDEPKEMLDAYKKSLTNDIRLNGQDAYADFSVEDFIEDYENYIGDKMDF